MTSTPPNPFGPADPVNPDGSPGPEEDADAAESSTPEDETERVVEDIEKYGE